MNKKKRYQDNQYWVKLFVAQTTIIRNWNEQTLLNQKKDKKLQEKEKKFIEMQLQLKKELDYIRKLEECESIINDNQAEIADKDRIVWRIISLMQWSKVKLMIAMKHLQNIK